MARRTITTALAGVIHQRSQPPGMELDPMAEILRRLDAIEQRLPATD